MGGLAAGHRSWAAKQTWDARHRERRSLMTVLMVRSRVKAERAADIEAAIEEVWQENQKTAVLAVWLPARVAAIIGEFRKCACS
jgi:hypothetical protein